MASAGVEGGLSKAGSVKMKMAQEHMVGSRAFKTFHIGRMKAVHGTRDQEVCEVKEVKYLDLVYS